MKSTALKLTSILVLLSFQYSIAQQKGVDDLVGQYQKLLHPPPDEAKNSLTYTQHYLDLRKKVAALGPESKAAFENGIAKFASDSGYSELHEMFFSEVASQGTTDSVQNKNASMGTNTVAMDSTVQMQIFDRKHKLVQTVQVKPADLDARIKKDGFQVSSANYDFNTRAVTLNLNRSDGSGTLAKVTLPSTGDVDAKYKLQNGQSLSIHSGADGTSSVQVSKAGKASSQKKK